MKGIANMRIDTYFQKLSSAFEKRSFKRPEKTDLKPSEYIVRPVQKEGWNLQVGLCNPDGEILYRGNHEAPLSLTRGHDISICDHTGTVVATGAAQPYKSWYLPDFVFRHDGVDLCTVRQARFCSNRVLVLFANGDQCRFHRSCRSRQAGEADAGWRYAVESHGQQWRVSLWELTDETPFLCALMHCFEWSLNTPDWQQ